jgi:broad specificity phosphatase PhoE
MTDTLPLRDFYIVRHGETDHNAAGLVGGEKAKLTQNGREQAKTLGALLQKAFPDPDAYVLAVSDLPRTVKTAKFALGRPILDHEKEPGLREQSAGRLGGRMPAEVLHRREQSWAGKLTLALAGPELYKPFAKRMRHAMSRLLDECPKDKALLCVSHSRFMHRLAQELAVNLPEEGINNTMLCHFVPDAKGQWAVSQLMLQDGVLQEIPIGTRRVASSGPDRTQGR